MQELEQGVWPIDAEALRARTQLASFPTMVAGLSSMVLVTQYVGPAEQHPNALLSALSAALCLVPYSLLVLTKNVEYLLSRGGSWLRIVDYLTWPLSVFFVACTTQTSAPVALMFPLAYAVVWPTWHPRNLAAASLLVWAMPLLRWLLVPQASLLSLAVLAGGGVVALALYLSSARRLDNYRAVRTKVQTRQLALESATTAQRNVRLAMSVHDGLSGLAAVAEAAVATAPLAAGTPAILMLLQQRVNAMLGDSMVRPTSERLADLRATAIAVGIELEFAAADLRAWDDIAAEDLLEIITELVTNHMRHGAQDEEESTRNCGSIRIGREFAVVEIESQLTGVRPSEVRALRAPQFGLRNVANRIDAYGGGLNIEAGTATFRVAARIPNRRTAFAPPLLRTSIPSFVLVFGVGAALMLIAHWYFVWVHLLWFTLIFIAHFKQVEWLARGLRHKSELLEAEYLNLHMETQYALVRARLLPFRERLQLPNQAELLPALGALRAELGALLFALEWHGTPSELAEQLALSAAEVASLEVFDAVPLARVHELVLRSRGVQ